MLCFQHFFSVAVFDSPIEHKQRMEDSDEARREDQKWKIAGRWLSLIWCSSNNKKQSFCFINKTTLKMFIASSCSLSLFSITKTAKINKWYKTKLAHEVMKYNRC